MDLQDLEATPPLRNKEFVSIAPVCKTLLRRRTLKRRSKNPANNASRILRTVGKMYGFRPIWRDSAESPMGHTSKTCLSDYQADLCAATGYKKRDERLLERFKGIRVQIQKNEVAIMVTVSSSASGDKSDIKTSIACSK